MVADAAATRSLPMLARIRAAGYPAALVAQDGLEGFPVPWNDLDGLIIGARRRGSSGPPLPGSRRSHDAGACGSTWINSLRRLWYAHTIGCHSVDGTYLAHGPDRNLSTLLGWLRTVAHETAGANDLHHAQRSAVIRS